MTWNARELRAEVLGEFIEAQARLIERSVRVWWARHARFVVDKRDAKKRWSLRALRRRMYRRGVIRCKNPRCQAEFTPYHALTTYCTPECRVRALALAAHHARKAAERASRPARLCIGCSAAITADRQPNAAFCSRRCCVRYRAAQRRGRLLATRRQTCQICQKTFASQRSDTVFCSRRCQRQSARFREQRLRRAS